MARLFFPQFISPFNKIKYLCAPRTRFGGGYEMLRERFPRFFKAGQIAVAQRPCFLWRQFIRLGKQQYEGNLPGTQEFHKRKIRLLWFQADVDEKEQAHQVGPFQYVIPDEFFPGLADRPGDPGVTISGQVGQVPLPINVKMIDQAGFSRGGGCFGDFFPTRKHVDERRLTHI